MWSCAWPFKPHPHKLVRRAQTIRRLLPTNSFSVFDHFVGLVPKRVNKNVSILYQCRDPLLSLVNIFSISSAMMVSIRFLSAFEALDIITCSCIVSRSGRLFFSLILYIQEILMWNNSCRGLKWFLLLDVIASFSKAMLIFFSCLKCHFEMIDVYICYGFLIFFVSKNLKDLPIL